MSKTKICTSCGKEKLLKEFPYLINKLRYAPYCYQCRRDKYKGDKHTKNRLRNRHLLTNYNLSLEDYNTILKSQNYRCAICKKPENKLKQQLSVDHNHKTGKIRGLLCPDCNRGLGCFKDNKNLLRLAIKYLK